MKKLLCLAVVAALFASCVSTPEPKGAADASPGKIETGKTKTIKVRVPYEKKALTYFSDGSLDQYALTEYDSAGLIKAKVRYSASGAVLERTEFAYQGSNLSMKTSKDSDGKIISTRAYRYDAAGRLTAEVLQDNAGKRLSTFEYRYNDKGQRTEWIVQNAAGATLAKTIYTYQNDLPIAAELQTGAGIKTGSSSYEYAAGKLVKQTFFDQSGAILRIETSTWTGGLMAGEERINAKGEILQKITYQYGKDGELLQKTVDDRVGKTSYSQGFESEIREETRTVKE